MWVSVNHLQDGRNSRRASIAAWTDLVYPFLDWTAIVTRCGRMCY